MVTILAGNECTGKSTCFEMLRKNFEDKKDVLFIKESHPDSIEEKWKRVCYINSLIGNNQEAVFDRATVLDDIIYSEIIDHKPSDVANEIIVHNVLKKCRIIYFDCKLDVIAQRMVARGDEFIKPHQLSMINVGYERAFDQFELLPIRIDVNGLTREQVYNKVVEVLEWNE